MAKRKASNPCSTSKKPYEETGFIIKSEDDFIIMDNEDEESECFETVNRSRNKSNQNVTSQEKLKSSKKNLSPIKKVSKLNEDENINVLYNCLSELRPKSPLVLNGLAHEIKTFPIVELKNFGEIKLPLKKTQAEELIKTSYRTSTGPDSQLILINKHVRDASHLLIRNPEWSSQLAQLVVRIAKQLGCGEGSEIEARLSEVFLYTSGSSQASVVFKDEWSESGMFGKLLIQLPSRFTGGKHTVSDNNGFVNKTLVFGQNDSSTHSNIYFAAFLNGLEHDVAAITSGHRLILVYSLYSDREEKSFLQKNESTIERLSVALSAMSEQSYRLGIVLENTYNPELFVGNGLKALQKVDAFRYELLKHANISIPRNIRVAFYTCFAYLTVTSQDSSKKFSRDSQIDIDALKGQTFKWKETSRTIEFRNWTNADGQSLFENHTFEQQFFSKVIRPHIKNSLDFDWSDLNICGPVYNEELFFETVKHPPVPPLKILKNKSTYSRCLLVCLPETHEFDIFLSTSLSCTIDFMFNLIVNGSEVPNLQDLENFERMLNEWKNKNNPIYKLSPPILTQYKKKVSMIIDKIGSKSRLSNNKQPVVKLENIDNEEMLLPSPSPLVNKSRKKSAHKITSPITTTSSANNVVWDQSSLRKGVKNLIKNLDIIRSLYENQQTEEALTVFQNYILPLMVDENEFVKIPMNSSEISDEDLTNINVNEPLRENYKHESTFFSIAKVTVNLSKRSMNSSQTLVDLLDDFTKMLVKHLDTDSMKLLVEELMSEWETFEDVSPIRSLIGFRCQWLENHIEPNLEFTWCMPEARFEQHAVIEAFLHSNRKIMSYVGKFATFKDALEFCRRFERASGLASGFTVKLEPCGIKPDSPISITKTIDYFEQKRLRNEAFTQELANLVDILNRNS